MDRQMEALLEQTGVEMTFRMGQMIYMEGDKADRIYYIRKGRVRVFRNISSGREISIGDLAQKLIALLRPEAKIVCEEQRLRPAASEVERLLGSNELLYALTGFRPQTPIEEGLKLTADWLRSHMDAYKIDRYML